MFVGIMRGVASQMTVNGYMKIEFPRTVFLKIVDGDEIRTNDL